MKITIKPLSIQSPLSDGLVQALDAEVETMYPDWRDFPFEGDGQWLNEGHGDMAEAEQKGELVLFVAFSDAADGEEAVGCVGVRVLPCFPLHHATGEAVGNGMDGVDGRGKEPTTAEIKRMYIVPACRGLKEIGLVVEPSTSVSRTMGPQSRGNTSLAALLLQHAETYARQQMGVSRLVLETGMRQVAAMKLYQRAGYTKRPDFGNYVGAGEDVGGLSRCFEKWLVEGKELRGAPDQGSGKSS